MIAMMTIYYYYGNKTVILCGGHSKKVSRSRIKNMIIWDIERTRDDRRVQFKCLMILRKPLGILCRKTARTYGQCRV